MKKETKSRNYIFTINNYTKKMLGGFLLVAESLEKHSYICFGLEKAPKTGTKHIQGYIELKDNQRFTFLHNYFDLKKNGKKFKFHLESANGSARDNIRYTSKEGNWKKFGEPKQHGRNDLANLKKEVENNPKDLKRIVKEYCQNFQQIRYAEVYQKHCLDHRDINNPPCVIWVHGNTGVGKTRLVYDSFESICSVSDYKWLGNDYAQQECFLMDDFRVEDISFNMLLKITDRFPLSLANKGGFTPLDSPFIVITTPHSIVETYKYIQEDVGQLERRITKIINLDEIHITNLKDLGENK